MGGLGGKGAGMKALYLPDCITNVPALVFIR